jgi:hypothetical protein
LAAPIDGYELVHRNVRNLCSEIPAAPVLVSIDNWPIRMMPEWRKGIEIMLSWVRKCPLVVLSCPRHGIAVVILNGASIVGGVGNADEVMFCCQDRP